MHLSLHCQVCVFSDWSIQVYHYFCRLVYKIIKYILVAMVVSPSLWITHCQSPPWWCTRLVTCTTSAALVTTSPHHLMRVVIVVRVRVVTLVVMVVRSLVRWCGDRSGRDHLTALATWLSSLVLATNNQSTTSPSSTATAQAHLTPQSRTRPPHDPELQILAADCCRPGLVWWRPDRVLIWHGAEAGRGRGGGGTSPPRHPHYT